jgi:hypothetical protein
MIVSKAQQRYMFAHQNDQSQMGAVAREFIRKTPEGAYKGLPERVAPATRPDFRAHVLNNIMNQLNQEYKP